MAPTQPATAGCCAVMAAFALGALALRLSEETNSIVHVMTWHYFPMLMVAGLGLFLGKKIFRW
jgi:hypothetical protein